MHANDLKFTNRQGQEIGEVTQVLDPGVDESEERVVAYPAGEVPGVEVTVGDINEDSFVKYPIIKIPGVDIESGDAQLTGVDKDFGPEPTGVELEVATDSYGKAYAIAPCKQRNKIKVYSLGPQGPTEDNGLPEQIIRNYDNLLDNGLGQQATEGMVFVENDIEKNKIQVPTSMAQQHLNKLTRVKHKVVAMT